MNSYQAIQIAASRAWEPPPSLTVSEWADENRVLSSESSAEAGRWRTSRAEYQREIMDCATDDQTEEITLMFSAQVGKTEMINNMVGYSIDLDPCPMLLLQPTLDMAQTWSKDRLAPMIRDTPVLRGRIADSRSRDSNNTMLHKTFPGGHITMAGANSPASLASRPIRKVFCDEVDRFPASAGAEGDPVSLARKRTATFWNRKIIKVSTPTVKGASRIEASFEESDQRYFYVPCPHCGEMQRLKWSNVTFDAQDLQEAHYACEQGCVIEERHKPAMLRKGEWRASQPFKGHAGFHLSELYSPWRTWTEVAADFLEMKKTPETLKTWVNTSLGESWEETGEGVDHTGLMERRENYDVASLPNDILLITAGVDVQGNRLEARSQGWGKDKERWNIEKKIFWGDPNQQECWNDLDAWLKGVYRVNGENMRISAACVDTGGHHTDAVYDFCRSRHGRRIFAIKGSSQYYAPIVSKPTQVGRQRVMLYQVGTDTAKDSILLSSLMVEEGPGCIHFGLDWEDEDFRQLTAEKRITKMFRGNPKLVWKATRERNEELDLHVYNLAAYAIINPDIGALMRKRNKEPAPQVEKKPPSSIQRVRPQRATKNWFTDV